MSTFRGVRYYIDPEVFYLLLRPQGSTECAAEIWQHKIFEWALNTRTR